MILHLFLIFNFGINALPIISNTSATFDLKQKEINHLENSQDKSPIDVNITSIISNIQIPKNFNVNEVLKNLKEFGIENLKNDKHLEGLPLDRDGKINPDFHKEIFLGNHELFQSEIQHDKQKRNKKLEEIFNEADQDHNERLSKEELKNYVLKNIQLHLQEAKDKNTQLFILIDTNQDGKITWHEYAGLYIKFHNMTSSRTEDLSNWRFIQESVDEKLQRELSRILYRWAEADSSGDNELNYDEFLEFRHPEIAGRSYKYIVDEIMSQLDKDGDQKLKETEFIQIPPYLGVNKNNWDLTVKQWSEAQKSEFHEMDMDGDGLLTRNELLNAYGIINEVHINIEIKKLFSKVDDSPKDDLLSISEIQNHADVFTDMDLVDIADAIHKNV